MTEGYNCKARYERLETDRTVFLDRARRCSELTIPTLVPPNGHSSSTKYYTPWQGIGARGVNNLSSKLLLSLLPPNSPFFRLVVDDFTLEKIAGTAEARAKVEEALGKIERAVAGEIEGTGMRAPIFLALKHLIIAGNVLVYLPKDGGMKIFCLDSYVCIRDTKGNLLEVIIKEKISKELLPQAMMAELKLASAEVAEDEKADEKKEPKHHDKDDELEVYTKFVLDGTKWRMHQEVEGIVVPGSEGSWPKDKAPMLALRWTPVEGQDYGRSYIEEYLGDLISLEALSKAIVDAAANTSKIVWMVRPNGVTKAKEITSAESGDCIVGNKDDVHCLQSDKQADMRVTYEAIKTITDRLAHAFLLNSAIQRNGERVTAEEIRYMAGELETALGGVYSVLTQEFQLPTVVRVMHRMENDNKLPELPKDVVKPQIVTGLAALGRGHDMSKYQALVQFLQPFGPEAMKYFNMDDLIKRAGTSLMIDMGGLVKTSDQMNQEAAQMQQAAQQQSMMELAGKAAPAAVKAMSDQATMSQQAQQAPTG